METIFLITTGILIAVVVMLLRYLKIRNIRSLKGPVDVNHWLCYYGIVDRPGDFHKFDLVVFDGSYHPVMPEKQLGKPIILGYASVGEVVNEGPFWGLVKNRSFLKEKNPQWDSWFVDVTDAGWQTLLSETVIPDIVKRGFDGFFLDNFDSGLGLPKSESTEAFTGKKDALLNIVSRIRSQYPDKWIAVNRGLPILRDLAPLVDFVVIEGLYSTYFFSNNRYGRVDAYAQNRMLQQVQQGLRKSPTLKVLTVDYAEPDQGDLIKEAIEFSKHRGFVPYVSTFRLNEIFFHTLSSSEN